MSSRTHNIPLTCLGFRATVRSGVQATAANVCQRYGVEWRHAKGNARQCHTNLCQVRVQSQAHIHRVTMGGGQNPLHSFLPPWASTQNQTSTNPPPRIPVRLLANGVDPWHTAPHPPVGSLGVNECMGSRSSLPSRHCVREAEEPRPWWRYNSDLASLRGGGFTVRRHCRGKNSEMSRGKVQMK